MTNQKTYTYKQAAAELGKHWQTVRKYVIKDRILGKHWKTGYLITAADIALFRETPRRGPGRPDWETAERSGGRFSKKGQDDES
jgi:hypothetical protein